MATSERWQKGQAENLFWDRRQGGEAKERGRWRASSRAPRAELAAAAASEVSSQRRNFEIRAKNEDAMSLRPPVRDGPHHPSKLPASPLRFSAIRRFSPPSFAFRFHSIRLGVIAVTKTMRKALLQTLFCSNCLP